MIMIITVKEKLKNYIFLEIYNKDFEERRKQEEEKERRKHRKKREKTYFLNYKKYISR